MVCLCACESRRGTLGEAHASTKPASASSAPVVASAETAPPLASNLPSPSVPLPEHSSRCNEQEPQPFLIKAHFDSHVANHGGRREWVQILDRAVRYRTEQYGYVEGYGDKAWNDRTPADEARAVTFFGVPVMIHRRIAGALACVESAIRARCAEHPYQPTVLSGHRKRNTYVNGEISNHVYGIALDVDPTRNPCCKCIGSWRESARCQNDKTQYERMDMPRCWVGEFERFGFYWLGHDRIEDTMHFEFLGDPNRILRGTKVASRPKP